MSDVLFDSLDHYMKRATSLVHFPYMTSTFASSSGPVTDKRPIKIRPSAPQCMPRSPKKVSVKGEHEGGSVKGVRIVYRAVMNVGGRAQKFQRSAISIRVGG